MSDAYRSQRSALEERASELRAKLAEISALDGERRSAAAELDAIQKRIADMQRRLHVLSNVKVASPCSVSWDSMKGDDRVRFCGQCSKNVFNLSALSEEEASAFVSQVEGSVCIRFYRRADGTMLTADCPVGVRRRRTRRILGAAVGAIAALGVGTTAFAILGKPTRPVMGAVAGELAPIEHYPMFQGSSMPIELPPPPPPHSASTGTPAERLPR